MDQELYSYDKYKGYSIYIELDSGVYYGSVYFNGTCYAHSIKSNSGDGCLSKCESWVDNNLEEYNV